MRQNEDNKTVAAMDVLFPGIGEIIGGSQREERYDRLLKRVQELNLPEKELWWVESARKRIMVVSRTTQIRIGSSQRIWVGL